MSSLSSQLPSDSEPPPPSSSSVSSESSSPSAPESSPPPSSAPPPPSSSPPPSSVPPSTPPPSSASPSATPPPSSPSSPSPSTPPSGGGSGTLPPGSSPTPGVPSSPTPSAPGGGSSASTYTETFLTTNSNGQSITTIRVTSTVVPTSGGNGNSNSSNSSTPVGAIVGGVVGGIALIIFIVLIWWFIKRRRQKDEFDDLNFDPDRTLHRPAHIPPGNMDLAGAEATPYTYQPSVAVSPPPVHGAYAAGGQPEMRQSTYYPESSHGGYTDVSSSTGPFLPNPHESWGRQHAALAAGGVTGAAAAGAGVQRSATTSSGSNEGSAYPPSRNSMGFTLTSPSDPNSHYQPSPATAYPNPYNPRSAKEREAFARTHPQPYQPGGSGLHLATQVETPRDELRPGSGGGVVVHQDGGRVPQREEDEIPPTYDSIPTDVRR